VEVEVEVGVEVGVAGPSWAHVTATGLITIATVAHTALRAPVREITLAQDRPVPAGAQGCVLRSSARASQ
ncbi:MAG: hypothetical protein ACRENE_16720, partial [Polyangiaceae bacterium]